MNVGDLAELWVKERQIVGIDLRTYDESTVNEKFTVIKQPAGQSRFVI